MFRYLLIAGIILVSLMTFQLYEVSYNTNDIRSNIRLLKTEITREKEKINVLRSELSAAKSPDNLKKLSDSLLKLTPQEIDQFITIDQLPKKSETPKDEADTLSDKDKALYDPIGELSAEVIKEN
ncbi:MAG: hypothetical protein HRU28_01240 [Rhizobiales bacterium]|nr:hypothetical protein [Hyphomicrobiales bacterium]